MFVWVLLAAFGLCQPDPSLILPSGCRERTGPGIERSSAERFDIGIAYRLYECDEGLSGHQAARPQRPSIARAAPSSYTKSRALTFSALAILWMLIRLMFRSPRSTLPM